MAENKMSQRNLVKARKSQRDMHDEIFKRIVNFVIGPKYEGKYQIEHMSKNNSKDKVIRLYAGYEKPSIYLYFGNKLRISSSLYTFDDYEYYNVFYDYYNEYESGLLPDDIEDYISVTTKFLMNIILHTKSVFADDFSSHMINQDAPSKFIENAPDSIRDIVGNYAAVLEYEWTWFKKYEIDYMIEVLSSNEYRRARGDYRTL